MSENCEACERRTATAIDPCDAPQEPYHLCAYCQRRLHALALRPLEWYNLAKRHGWCRFLLHDDFYDEDGRADQPKEEVIEAERFPAPVLAEVAHDPELLLDYSITRWHLDTDTVAAWGKHAVETIEATLTERFLDTVNREVRSCILDLASALLGDRGVNLVRRAWSDYPESVDLASLALASSHCLPYREAWQRVIDALGHLPRPKKRWHLHWLAEFRSPDTLDWIESEIFEPITEGWGNLAAASRLDWRRVAQWLKRGRPLSLVAIDALNAIIRPSTSSLREGTRRLHNVPDKKVVVETLLQYRKSDAVPRVQRRIDSILGNLELLFDRDKPADDTEV